MKANEVLNLKSPTLKFSISGLRGIYPEDLNPGNLPILTSAFAKTVGKGPVAVARDSRPTGRAIEQIVLGTLTALGREVHHLGLVPTPTIKAYIKKNKLAGGIMISASHNPVNYNAFKLIGKEGAFFDAKANEKFHSSLSQAPDWGSFKQQGQILDKAKEATDAHISEVLQVTKLKLAKKIRVALDCVGGAGSIAAIEFLKRVGVETVSIFSEESPFFPRPPEPVPAALKKLGALVKEKKCDIGFALDPDADRLAIVGPDGRPIGEELTLPLALMAALPERKGNVVVNLSSSYLNQWVAESHERELFRSAVGEANVVALMKKKKAVFGGEGNGGVIDPQISSVGRDTLSGMGWILKLISGKQSLYEIIQKLPSVHIIKKALPAGNDSLAKVYARVKKKYPDMQVNDLDGLHLSASSGLPWVHLRSSNTEPVIRIIAEAGSRSETTQLVAGIESVL